MQQFFHDLQGKLWVYLVNAFNKATDLGNTTWSNLKPYFEIGLNWLERLFQYILTSLSYLLVILINLFSFAWIKIKGTIPFFEKIYKQNRYEAAIILLILILIVSFWIWMIIHVKRNEVLHKKIWMTITVFLGPIGALAYYILRKKRLEKQQSKQDKVMMSFFSPMHSNEEVKEKRKF